MSRWRFNLENGTFAGLEADFAPTCPYCGGYLEAVAVKLLNFQLNEPAWWERGEKRAHAIDVECWCPECGYWEPYGVAVSEDHWNAVQKKAAEEYTLKHPNVGKGGEHPDRP